MAQSTVNPNKTEEAANRPVQTVRYGAVRAAIWRNVLDNGNATRPMYRVTFGRLYRDANEWKESASFGCDDLLLLGKVANEAHTWITKQRSADMATPC